MIAEGSRTGACQVAASASGHRPGRSAPSNLARTPGRHCRVLGLDQAARTLRRVSAEQWGTACLRNPQYVEVQRATCYTRLGEARAADRLWSQIIPSAPTAARRDVGVWTARQATAVAKGGEPERAVELSRSAVRIALDTGSARARRELGTVETAMRPWQAEAIGRDLAEVLAPVTEGRDHG